jgi:hypothetical protein
MLRVIEEQMPPLMRPYAGTGRVPYQYTPAPACWISFRIRVGDPFRLMVLLTV